MARSVCEVRCINEEMQSVISVEEVIIFVQLAIITLVPKGLLRLQLHECYTFLAIRHSVPTFSARPLTNRYNRKVHRRHKIQYEYCCESLTGCWINSTRKGLLGWYRTRVMCFLSMFEAVEQQELGIKVRTQRISRTMHSKGKLQGLSKDSLLQSLIIPVAHVLTPAYHVYESFP